MINFGQQYRAVSLLRDFMDSYTAITSMFTVSLKRPLKPSEKPSEKTSEKNLVEPYLPEATKSLAPNKKPSEKTSEKILNFIGEDPKITIEELAIKVGKSTRAMELQLKKLKEPKQ